MNAIEVRTPNMITAGTTSPAMGSLRVIDGNHRVVALTWLAGNRLGRTEVVNLSPLIDTHKFYAPLRRDAALFKTARIIDDGYAIAWGDGSIDMPASSIERLAEEAMTGNDFSRFLMRHELTHQAAAAALGRSKRQIENYLQYETLPRMVVLACIGYETRKGAIFTENRSTTSVCREVGNLSASWSSVPPTGTGLGGWTVTVPTYVLAAEQKQKTGA